VVTTKEGEVRRLRWKKRKGCTFGKNMFTIYRKRGKKGRRYNLKGNGKAGTEGRPPERDTVKHRSFTVSRGARILGLQPTTSALNIFITLGPHN